jgi:hypothetical protein
MRISLDDERLSPTERLTLVNLYSRLRGPPRQQLSPGHKAAIQETYGDDEPDVIQIKGER